MDNNRFVLIGISSPSVFEVLKFKNNRLKFPKNILPLGISGETSFPDVYSDSPRKNSCMRYTDDKSQTWGKKMFIY
ncbi:hypothetical protein ADM99_15205 [Leptolinea tardivitalis]|uniref:Uncharacterized protein n=1 Tax=Leptolinea tardivitalis TaxID=229920 RepID=A0A0P6X6A2_9CHLR|nr:hypothetical protein ADM99_15205 [Leptolinea tardivitalis]